ncbi:MAG: Alanine racemase [Candidatus Kaiserbacteria bacterium GW2011_GWA2_58_9]|uniref:Alanine racemase n=1 Tax=Candidatus Kaiserbacteria bacterium GW2011_GWA2_58_9 TaxID=1618672 RepID=A0A0G1YXC7_9BACT|nr:MAG: Alanine racemase [Candidatus Kaiserbacteria bacterium GW2011_GWA2_58_9]
MKNFLKKAIVLILICEARLVLSRYRPKIIAITGSMGKTAAKDAICAALSGGGLRARKSEKSFNSELGVPLTILGLENAWRNPLRWAENILRGLWLAARKTGYPAWLVLEVGADRPGDIRKIARWLRPDIAVITGVPEIPVHVEFFRSAEELAREKRALAEYLAPGGTLVLNGDDSHMAALCAEFAEQTVTYGMDKRLDWHAAHLSVEYEKKKPTGIRFTVDHQGAALPVSIRSALGRPRAYAALAAFAVAYTVGVGSDMVARALSAWMPPPGRMRIIPGANGSTIIDDTYNSSPAAALSALDTLKDINVPPGGKRIAVLGDMLELGRYASEAHRNVGARAAACADTLITVGFRARAAGKAALDAGLPEGNIREYEMNESGRAGEELKNKLSEGDVVLVKGSQSMRMERAVEALMAEPERASELLVRQDPEWLTKD